MSPLLGSGLARADSPCLDSRVGDACISTGRRRARTLGARTSEGKPMRFAREQAPPPARKSRTC